MFDKEWIAEKGDHLINKIVMKEINMNNVFMLIPKHCT